MDNEENLAKNDNARSRSDPTPERAKEHEEHRKAQQAILDRSTAEISGGFRVLKESRKKQP
jgi:hypothetical protein